MLISRYGTGAFRRGIGFFSLVLVIFGFSLLMPRDLKAQSQFTCTGAACALLPFSQQNLSTMLNEFQTQYTDKLFDDMSEAATLANIAGSPICTVNLERFTLGTNLSLSYLKPYDITVNIPGTASFEAIPSAGGAVSPRVFAGINLGWVVGLFSDSSGSSHPLSPGRFDVYVSFMDMVQRFNDNEKFKGDMRASVHFRGFNVNYHLVEGKGRIFRFHGVGLGAGFFTSRQAIQFKQAEEDLDLSLEGQSLIWKGQNFINYDSKVDTYPVELKTGVQFAYLLNLYLGVGVAINKGGTDFQMNRTGPVFVSSDVLSAIGVTVPESLLTLNIEGKGRVPRYMSYIKAGVGFNLTAVKLTFEGIATEGVYAGNIGLRFEL